LHQGALNGLADVLLRDARGRPFESGSEIRAAIELVRRAQGAIKTDAYALWLGRLLLRVGGFEEAERLARTAQPTEDRDKLIVTAAAGTDAKRAIRIAGELRSGGIRTQLLESAADWMLALQR